MGAHLVYRTANVIARRHSSAVKRMTRLRHAIMGSRHLLLAAGVAIAFGPAMAQDAAPTQPPPPGSLQGFQLDPSRDTSKPRPPEREGPEIESRPAAPLPAPAPAVTQPPPVSRTVQPTPTPSPAAQQPARQREPQQSAPQTRGAAAAPMAQQPAPAETAPAQPAPVTSAPLETPPPTAAEPAAPEIQLPAGNVAETAAVPAETPSSSTLPWIIAALAVAGIAALTLVLRRRKRPAEDFAEPDIAPETAARSGDIPPSSADTPEAAAPVQPARPSAALAIEFHPLGARHTLIGAAVGYRIILHNEGEVAAENVAIATMIANADARQEQELAGFFARPVHAPSHSADRIEPGFSVEFTGELRLASDAIVPIKVRDRALLIPLVAFSAHYGWDGGNGYSAAAFIVGEESDPPRERMAPFRIDQGPRQYRSVGSRAARTALVG
ncbi:hypothetical protein [Sphingobium phenoxybenzoativorans]|uniref:hypothetical protein n=1 Tax=Sphingobium phenoxybenzoativorans TaxID=1592790 RepID=UPI00087273CB|nr:hypothetical protein [Sphingobium phenoxybenzoativorans]